MIEPALIEFPADDPERAQNFWSGLLGRSLQARVPGEGTGWQTAGAGVKVGVHARGRGPGDTAALPYFTVADMEDALGQVAALGGSVVHRGGQWSICRDCEGNPFGLALGPEG